MKTMVFVLAGGSGTRLAPLSLTLPGKLPKQFLALLGERTMLQQTVDRIPNEYPVVIVPEIKYAEEVQRQVPQAQVLAEPFGCNTAAAIGLCARYALEKNGQEDVALFFLPADHIMNKELFQKYFNLALSTVEETKKIVALGITPDRPETGYGYIQAEAWFEYVHKVKKFVEKPDLETAKQYLVSGDYYWNAGMFAMTARTILAALEKNAPLIAKHILAINFNNDWQKEIAREYQAIKEAKQNISIDYAVMEKEAENMLLIPADRRLEWNDVGGWAALEKYVPKQNGNLILNYLDIVIETSQKDLLIVTTANGILICPLLLSQRAKEIIPGIEAGKTVETIDSPGTKITNTTKLYVGVIGLKNMNIYFDGKKLKF